METVLFTAVTILGWGVWLTPMQNVRFKSQQVKTFYVGCANLAAAAAVTLVRGYEALPPAAFWLSFAGGVIWAVSGLCAFTAASKIGMARAFGIWAPLNIVMGLLWGGLLFHEFINTGPAAMLGLFGAAAMIIAGILLIIFSRGEGDASARRSALLPGLLAAVGAGVLWGTYFIPVKFTGASSWAASLPMALGILFGSAILVALDRAPLALPTKGDYARTLTGGALWSAGNYGMLLLVERIGAGRGFTIAQTSLAVAALLSIFWLKDPPPRTRAAAMIFLGCFLAMLGGILLGNL